MPNKLKFISLFLGTLLLFISTQAISALPGESIILDPNTGDYTLTYWDSDGPNARIRRAVYVPPTKIDPLLKSTFKFDDDSEIVYSYRITNGQKSRQSLITMLFDPISNIVSSTPLPTRFQDVDLATITQIDRAAVSAITTPEYWIGRSTTSRAGGLRIGWSYRDLRNDTDGLLPNETQTGFGFSSKDIPGIGIAQFQGNAPVPMYSGEGPIGELATEFAPIEQNDVVTRNAAVPTIRVPAPFDAAVLLDRIQTHMHTWIGMKLLDTTFSAQLDHYFQTATDAYRNQGQAGNGQVARILALLERQYEELERSDEEQVKKKSAVPAKIDKLAALVLYFDLKYVMQRASGR